jgi:hypothetical protein
MSSSRKVAVYYCTANGCACGRPVIFKVIDGRVVPLHVRK